MKTIEFEGCRVALRRFEGPVAREFFAHCWPIDAADAGRQGAAIYRALVECLSAEGTSFDDVVTETVFLENMAADIDSVRGERARVLTEARHTPNMHAINEIEQPPLSAEARLAVSLHAVVPGEGAFSRQAVETSSDGSAEGFPARGLRVEAGNESRLYAAGLCGSGDNAFGETLGMFELAEDLLREAGMNFGDVVRTWIYLRDIDRDYSELNAARREFFEARGLDPVPASTGIGGGPVSAEHRLSLGIYAVKAGGHLSRTVMTSPTLNEAPQYGADFVRGLRVAEANRVALHVSGTASIDERGDTAHVGDFDAQAERMLVNIAALLEGQGADFGDVVSATTYLKHREHAESLRAAFQKAGFEGFPVAVVVAPICRPELLCETEVLALLPVVQRGQPD